MLDVLPQFFPKPPKAYTPNRDSIDALESGLCGLEVHTCRLAMGAGNPIGIHVDGWSGELVVRTVNAGECADREGTINVGDVISKANDRSVNSIEELKAAMHDCSAVRLELLRRPPIQLFRRPVELWWEEEDDDEPRGAMMRIVSTGCIELTAAGEAVRVHLGQMIDLGVVELGEGQPDRIELRWADGASCPAGALQFELDEGANVPRFVEWFQSLAADR